MKASSPAKRPRVDPEASPQAGKAGGGADAGPEEDAPPGHEAWAKVRIKAGRCCFKIAGGPQFQTTMGAAGGSEHHAERIARLCYVKFVDGLPKDQVIAFRNEAYQQLGGKIPAPYTRGKAPVAAGEAPPTSSVDETEKKKKKSRYSRSRFTIRVKDGKDVFFSVNANRAGSQEEADRIAKLCKEKFEEGWDQDRVAKYRDEMYQAGGSKPRKKRKHEGTTQAIVEKLRERGRLEGALCVEGRNLDAANASINGVYMQVEGGFEDCPAYEKFVSDGKTRFLAYTAAKKRWKIVQNLGDAKGSFAYLNASSGATPPSDIPEAKWSVFDGKERGYNEDPSVRCLTLAQSLASQDGAQAHASSSASTDSGDSEDSDDSGESESSALQGAKAAGASVPSKANLAGQRPAGRVCGKMLVRSGLRCGCHFRYVHLCPLRGKGGT